MNRGAPNANGQVRLAISLPLNRAQREQREREQRRDRMIARTQRLRNLQAELQRQNDSTISEEERLLQIEHRKLFKKARKQVAKLQKQLRQAVDGHDDRRVDAIVERILASFYCKLIAFEKARRKTKERFRPSTAEMVEMARTLDVYRLENEIVVVQLQFKDAGTYTSENYRQIKKFRIRNKARQYLCRIALEPIMMAQIADAGLYSELPDGRNQAVESVIDKIVSGEAKFFAEYDLEDFFSNIGVENRWGRYCRTPSEKRPMEEWVPLPPEVIRSSVLATDSNLRFCRNEFPNVGTISQIMLSRDGVPQGSAVAALIAAFVMSHMLLDAQPHLGKGVLSFPYGDNVGLLSATKAALQSAGQPLVRSAQRSPFGFLRLNQKQRIRRVCDGFEFLGYFLKRRTVDGRYYVEIDPKESKCRKFQSEFARKLRAMRPTSITSAEVVNDNIDELTAFLKGWACGYSLVPEIDKRVFSLVKETIFEASTPLKEIAITALVRAFGRDAIYDWLLGYNLTPRQIQIKYRRR